MIELLKLFSKEKIDAMSYIMFPEETEKDDDGDWHDLNDSARIGFQVGAITAIQQLEAKIAIKAEITPGTSKLDELEKMISDMSLSGTCDYNQYQECKSKIQELRKELER